FHLNQAFIVAKARETNQLWQFHLQSSHVSTTSVANVLCAILAFTALKVLWKIFYNLYFHPLSKFPGPKFAAMTFLYEYYFDLIRNGTYIWEIEKMHAKYGPIVRFNPNELHIKDSSFHDEIYSSGLRKTDRDPNQTAGFASPGSLISTVHHDRHRLRRGLINNFFSKRAVVALEPSILDQISILMTRFEEAKKKNTVVCLNGVFAALTADVISEYSFDMSFDFLKSEADTNDLQQAVEGSSKMYHVLRILPLLHRFIADIPLWLMKMLFPEGAKLLEVQQSIRKQCVECLKDSSAAKGTTESIFSTLADPSTPAEERTADRLTNEAWVVLAAGMETTARTLSVGMFHLLNNKVMMLKLREELKKVMPKPTSHITWSQIEHLPFLNGVVHEALRLSYGVVFRSARIAPTEAIVYHDRVIPAGTPVSQSAYFVLTDPKVFPAPFEFQPERWIEAESQGKSLSRFFVTFGKGTRQCLGMNLANCELYLTIAHIARRFDMELYETGPECIEVKRDHLLGYPKADGAKVMAKVIGIVE
ncbi:Benzoate 4-monooxygenase cytochrome P450, partial [Penicillium taxi]|uniref:Benzoate 4-monooxygenase cytochrome P450 n=1 Tax=Penicillium taxi TaxID=168475 RepID=UPI0025458E80